MNNKHSSPEQVLEERRAVYGPIEFNLTQTAKVWGAMLSIHQQREIELPPELVGLMMGVSKCLRACHIPGGYVMDHHIDWTNYLKAADDLQKTRLVQEEGDHR